MSTKKLSNIPLKDFRKFLKNVGLERVKTGRVRGGHEKWIRNDLRRPVTIQTHIDSVPVFIVRQILRNLNISRKEFFEYLD